MNRDAALRKVLACLRLAKSNNPNEAASALRQARALMEKYGLTEDDALASEIREAEAATGYRGGNVPQSMLLLAQRIAFCYRCEPVLSQGIGKTTIRFFGGGSDARIAAYAFTVLNRQLRTAKAKHTARIRKRSNKEARGEAFAIGWVIAVIRSLPDEKPQGELAHGITRAIERLGETDTTTGREIASPRSNGASDFRSGVIAGKNAQLRQGIAGSAQRQIAD